MAITHTTVGAVVFDEERDEFGRYAAYLTYGEFAGNVWLDLSNAEAREVSCHRTASGSISYVFNAAEYEMLQAIVGAQLAELPERTMLALKDNLGDANADRLLEKLGLMNEPD